MKKSCQLGEKNREIAGPEKNGNLVLRADLGRVSRQLTAAVVHTSVLTVLNSVGLLNLLSSRPAAALVLMNLIRPVSPPSRYVIR